MQRRWQSRCGACALFPLLFTAAVQSGFAANSGEPSFTSPEQAVEALDKAVKTDEEAATLRLLGQLSSSGDLAQDKADRQRFVQKYAEMHRLVKEPDGTIVLYIGAENWPFPVPLVSNDGKWHFDVDAGAQEITFRRVGEDETTAIGACRAIAGVVAHRDSDADDSAVKAFAQKVAGAGNAPAEAFGGYYFRLLQTPNGATVIAYPSEYRSTGVMTFAVIGQGPVYEKDLGPNTATVAQAMKTWTPNPSWQLAQ
ncbi:MAG TPA: DUF2950 family protein [Bryobacteraceae bacterium]|nr:DUF2950 family protein [Bryobacteraceae bacterium]